MRGPYDAGVRPLRWLVSFAIDYGSIALVMLMAGIYLVVPIFSERSPYHPGLSGIGTVFGVLLALLAVKLWRDVRTERRRER